MPSTHVDPASAPSTEKGRATRERIVAVAADLMYQHGAAGTSTPSVRDAAGVSSSQIYHYFGNKNDLTRAVIAYQADTIVAEQTQFLKHVEDLDALHQWRSLLIDYARQRHGAGGCPLGSLASELADKHPWAREVLSASFDRWLATIRTALATLVDNQVLRDDTDVEQLALALLAAVQGGLLLAQARHNTDALEAGLDTALAAIHSHANSTSVSKPTARASSPLT